MNGLVFDRIFACQHCGVLWVPPPKPEDANDKCAKAAALETDGTLATTVTPLRIPWCACSRCSPGHGGALQ